MKAWDDLGDAYMQKARETADVTYYNHAEQSYKKAVVLKPDNVPALNGLAWVNGGRHEFEKSIAWAEKAIAVEPKNNDAYGLIGDANVEMGDYDAAYKHYQQMLDLRPDTSSYSRGAHLLWLMGDERKAQWLMVKAIKAGGPFAENTAWCRAQLALMLMSTGAQLPAEQTLQDALKYTPHNYQLLIAMGRLQAAKKDYPAAISYYQQAVAGVPVHDALVALGDIYTLTGKPDEARKQYALVEATHQANEGQRHSGRHADRAVRRRSRPRHSRSRSGRWRPSTRRARTCMWRIRSHGVTTRRDGLQGSAGHERQGDGASTRPKPRSRSMRA